MNIYYKENTGLATAQDENCDYFVINTIGANLINQTADATILFWEKLEHAQSGKSANLSRSIHWDLLEQSTIDAGLDALLLVDNITTTNGETITLKDAELVE